jgi:hypothetical protein
MNSNGNDSYNTDNSVLKIEFLCFIFSSLFLNSYTQTHEAVLCPSTTFFLHPISIVNYTLSIYSSCLLPLKCKNLPVVRHSYRTEASISVDVIVVVIVVPTV